jgi:hypothetical protein
MIIRTIIYIFTLQMGPAEDPMVIDPVSGPNSLGSSARTQW